MVIRFVCPNNHTLKVPDHRAGKKGRCPECNQKLIVPEANPQPSDLLEKQKGGLLVDSDVNAPLGFDDGTQFPGHGS